MIKPTLRLAMTPGAENGVGPELLLMAMYNQKHKDLLDFFWCGDAYSLHLAGKRAGIVVNFLDTHYGRMPNGTVVRFFDDMKETTVLERQAGFLKKGVELAKSGQVDAIITGPVDKACLRYLDDGEHHGQTEYLARHLGKNLYRPFMSFMGGPFILSLLTTHVPLRSVADAISFDNVLNHLEAVASYGCHILKKERQELRIAVLGLNPHAGEAGLLGHEELEIITPAIRTAQKMGLNAYGPLPADGFFAYFHRLAKNELPDIVVATYHDQGLIPYKILAQGLAVNVTLGLTVPRTSPAHGTAYEIAGRNLACPESTQMALQTAIDLANGKNR